jgi:hypothetical protein
MRSLPSAIARPLAAASLLAGALLLISPPALRSQEPPAGGSADTAAGTTSYDPLFLGYGAEPEMVFGGRTVASLQSLGSRGFASLFRAERHSAVAPAWEFPLAAALLLVQHEIGGHGGRAREFGLSPSYAFNYDFSAATGIERPPRSNEEGSLLAAGGTEADGVLAHGVLLDLLRPGGADGAKVPLAFMTKLDLTLYVRSAVRPRAAAGRERSDFERQFDEGNDVVIYLVSRQADRTGAAPADVWAGTYRIDFTDLLLEDTWRDARVTALWNLADPSLVAALIAYFRDHVIGGAQRVEAPRLHLPNGWGLTAGTRGALGPREVTRFLDLHATTPAGVWTVYVRDLDSTVDRTYGAGIALSSLALGSRLDLALAADAWNEPRARERSRRDGTGWNLEGEIDVRLGPPWGLAGRLGAKSEGFLPGRPLDSGPYLGLGVTAAW